MLGFFTDAVENALTVGEKLVMLDMPTKREIAKLADAGLTVAAIAGAVGVSVDLVEAALEEKGNDQ